MANREESAAELFEAALDVPPERRSAFLNQVCGDDPSLRERVETLLRQHDRIGSFLEGPGRPKESNDRDETEFSAPLRLEAGTRLGRYVLMEPLGSGGMGVVYRARDERLDRTVAVKVLSAGVLISGDARRRFRHEALALAKLSHAHIAAIYDVGQQDGVDFLVMECIAGQSLAEKLHHGPLPVKEATEITLQIAQALEDAHEHGIVHRDLKPANVMVTAKGQVKVLDFGIAKLLATTSADTTSPTMETFGIIGTPMWMSPEQVQEKPVDARTDLWSLGVVYYQALTGETPFRGDSSVAVMRAIHEQTPVPVRQLRPDAPLDVEQIVSRALEKNPDQRYQSAAEVMRDASDALAQFTAAPHLQERARGRSYGPIAALSAFALLVVLVAGWWIYDWSSKQRWAREGAVPEIQKLFTEQSPLAAFLILQRAERYAPSDPQLTQLQKDHTTVTSITSSPSGASVEIQDYLHPEEPWYTLGVTPLESVRVPKGDFRWKVWKPGSGDMVVAPHLGSRMNFALDANQKAPDGMVYVAAQDWGEYVGFIGWIGPYKMPAYYIDRLEVTNREYQRFVDSGGYSKREYWPASFSAEGRPLSWEQARARFRDTTDRPGPSTWMGGHYPEGKGDFPVSGVSWFEASAYAAFAGKQLPVVAQWFEMAPPDAASYTTALSNISRGAIAPAGAFKGLGPFGTYDAAGNAREWVANSVDNDLRFVLGGSWGSPSYLYYVPEAASPLDRSGTNGFRCVRNLGPLPQNAAQPVQRVVRDFATFKPAPDAVFKAYELLYAYPKSPLNAKVEGTVRETADWREEKVSFDTAYRGERMSAYLFLPKSVRPPYQTVLFFPSARVQSIPNSADGRELGDIGFFDYVIQSGRAVMYPIYESTYERQVKFFLPSGSQSIDLTTDWYKDAARSLDYLATRTDIDNQHLAYLGVSMGAADGIIVTTMLQDRLKTAIFLDGGYFLDPPPPGGDQADFAPRMKKPVLMVNGRYDYVFSVERAQNPMFAMLGTRAEDKRHVLLETPHDVTQQRPQLVRLVLDWLDRYMGPVN